MKKQRLIIFFMSIFLIFQPSQSLSPEGAAIATGVTTLGIATGAYCLLKHHKIRKAERYGLTALITGVLGYGASVLWFGLTPEMRYLFAKKTVDMNNTFLYATKPYGAIDDLLDDYEGSYTSYAWLVYLHDDMVKQLVKTRSAIKAWTLAQTEAPVAQFPWVAQSSYDALQKHAACLEHNLLLVRRYQPFVLQYTAWLSAHNCHYARV